MNKEFLKLLKELDRRQRELERSLASDLIRVYEEARKELYIKFLESGQKVDLYRIESLMGQFDKWINYYTKLSVTKRTAGVNNGFSLGKQVALEMLKQGGIKIEIGSTINKGMIESLLGNIPSLAGRVEQSILYRIRDELVRGALLGESMDKIAKRILGTGLTQEGMVKPFSSVSKRSLVIARTEIIKSSDIGYEDSMVKMQKHIKEEIFDAWLTAMDDKVEKECRSIAAGTNPRFHSISGFPGVYRRGEGPHPVIHTHPGCRCRRIPFLKSWHTSGVFRLDELRRTT